MAHKLIHQIADANVDEAEIMELYQDLISIYDNPFDDAIIEAVNVRKCAYVEIEQPRAN